MRIDRINLSGSLSISSSLAVTPLRVNDNYLFVSNTGNVGIGTNNPTSKLVVTGSIAVQGQLKATTLSGSFTGSIKLPTIPLGTSETNIVLVDGSGGLVYRNNLSLTGAQGAQGAQGLNGSVLGCAILHERLGSGVSSNVTFTNNVRVSRQINTISFNTLGITLSQSPNWRFTIPTAGTYKIIASAVYSRNRASTPSYSAFSSRLMIRNETLAIDDVIIGENSRLHIYATDADNGQAMQQAFLIGVISIEQSTEFTLRQVCTDVVGPASKTGGSAMSSPSGVSETYATIEIQRLT